MRRSHRRSSKRLRKDRIVVAIIIVIALILITTLMVHSLQGSKSKNVNTDISSWGSSLKKSEIIKESTSVTVNESESESENIVTEAGESNSIEQTDSSKNDASNTTDDGYPDEPTYINGILIVNKTYPLPKDYNPGALEEKVLQAFYVMQDDAEEFGLNIYISSGFRSFEDQYRIYNNYVESYGKEAADTFSARAGYSEHQSGLAFDLNSIDDSFAETAEGVWVAANAYKYGFIIRYPKGKEDITGYKYESWHLRYVGTELATELYNSDMTLEEYCNISSAYKSD